LEAKSHEQRAPDLVVNGDALASTSSAGNGGAIAAAIVSEYEVSARRAQLESNVGDDGRGVRGETDVAESSLSYIQRRIREIVAKNRDRERPP